MLSNKSVEELQALRDTLSGNTTSLVANTDCNVRQKDVFSKEDFVLADKKEKDAFSEQKLTETLTQLSDIYKLNDKLISTLQEMESQITAKEQLINQFKEELGVRDKKIEEFKKLEEQRKIEAFNAKKEALINEWCDVLCVKDKESVRGMFSAFKSEDALDNVRKQLDNKRTESFVKKQEETELKPLTVCSSSLREAPENLMTQDKFQELSAKEKTDYLFNLYSKKNN